MDSKKVLSSELIVDRNNTKNHELITNNSKGQSLIEVIVASIVGIMVVTALTFATIFSLRNANFAKNSAQATKLAQQGIERVRIGRARDSTIFNFSGTTVNSWTGSGTPANSLWNYQVTAPGRCSDPTVGRQCYFDVYMTGELNYLGSLTSFPSNAPSIGTFQRAVILSDEVGSYSTQKTVTVVVTWTDSTGPHESKLTTVLRKI